MIDYVGRQLGNYRLIRQLGHGGFASVYLGEHVYLKTEAAIKILQVQLGSDEHEEFLNEARTIAHLVHPHIIRVLDFGIEENTPFLVMDYAPHGSLRQRYRKGTRLSIEEIVPIVKQVASALQYAHSQNLVHRDIKPGNLLLGVNDEVLLSDFGIAVVAQNSRSQSTEEHVSGTIGYMAPEQIEGKPRPASDQYALGIIIYEWLCGERPFQGSFAEIMGQQMMAPPPSLHDRVPTISTDVEEAVRVALAKDPRERFASVQAFAYALEQTCQATPQQGIAQVQPPVPVQLTPVPIQPGNIMTDALALPANEVQLATDTHAASTISQRNRSRTEQVQQQINMTIGNLPHSIFPHKEKRHQKIERQGRRVQQGIAMFVGAALYGCLLLLAQYTFSYTNMTFIAPITLAFIVSCAASALLPFFGAAFGPWVGFFTGVVGMFIARYGGTYLLDAAQQRNISNWIWYAGSALAGLLAGVIMRGRPGSRKNTLFIFLVDIIGAFSVDLGFLKVMRGWELLLAAIITVVVLHTLLVSYQRARQRKMRQV